LLWLDWDEISPSFHRHNPGLALSGLALSSLVLSGLVEYFHVQFDSELALLESLVGQKSS
jgi:hypothetical protein